MAGADANGEKRTANSCVAELISACVSTLGRKNILSVVSILFLSKVRV